MRCYVIALLLWSNEDCRRSGLMPIADSADGVVDTAEEDCRLSDAPESRVSYNYELQAGRADGLQSEGATQPQGGQISNVPSRVYLRDTSAKLAAY
jgi:hypothetical protein